MEGPLRNELFWDVNPETLSLDQHRGLVIERVFSLGNLKELEFVIHYYGWDTVREELMKVGYLDPKTFEFATKMFQIPKSRMRCYIRKQSRSLYWI
jgi:hypothetical protein